MARIQFRRQAETGRIVGEGALAEARLTKTPLAVDLDGTLIHADMLWVSLRTLLKQNILSVCLLPFWLARGKACLKHEIAKRVILDASVLPYNEEFVTFLREQRRDGRSVILITGCTTSIAQKIADYLGVFSEVIASTNKDNMTGKRKAKALQDRFGERGFEYAGNEKTDLQVWSASCGAIVVNAPERLVAKVEKVARLSRSFQTKRSSLAALIGFMRLKS